MSYSIARGLAEGYDAYRGRERDIEEKNRRIEGDELRAAAEGRAVAQEERAAEAADYGISRRGFNEETQQTQHEAAKLGLEQNTATFNEWKANTVSRNQKNKLELDTLRQQLKASGLTLDEAEIDLKAKQGAEKYNQWTNQWLQGEDIDTLVKKFNTDDDGSNDIHAATGDEASGWEVTFKNPDGSPGRKMKFADRDQVAIHLQSMADPNFHQTYLLQMEAQKASTAAAVAKAATKTADTVSKEKTTWENMTRQQVKDYFTESIKESIVSLGSEGSRDMAGDVRAVVDSIGAGSQYGLINSDVTRIANQMAKTMLVKEPAERKAKASAFLEKQRDEGVTIPDEDSDEYANLLDRQMAADYDESYDIYKRAVYSKLFYANGDGSLGMVDPTKIADYARAADPGRDAAGDTITTAGLERTPEAAEAQPAPVEVADAGLPPRTNRAEQVPPPDVAAQESTFVLTPESMVKSKRAEYGLKQGGARTPPKASKAQKKRIGNDFDANFAGMSKQNQGAWFREFGRHLSNSQQARAKEAMTGTKLAAGS